MTYVALDDARRRSVISTIGAVAAGHFPLRGRRVRRGRGMQFLASLQPCALYLDRRAKAGRAGVQASFLSVIRRDSQGHG